MPTHEDENHFTQLLGPQITINSLAGDVKLMEPYPKARIPQMPVLSSNSLGWQNKTDMPSILDAGSVRFVTSGRAAIALALQHMAVKTGDVILIPAYHCSSMVEPVLWAGASPMFYRINPDTSINLSDVESKINPSIRALMVTHYFGFPQNMTEIRAFCDKHKILLIEDCAHAFFGQHAGKPLGSFGDYAIASAMKFFPIYDGGCLVSSRISLDSLSLEPGGWRFESKSAINTLEQAFAYGRLKLIKWISRAPLYLKDVVWKNFKSFTHSTDRDLIGPSASHGGAGLESNWINKRISLVSKIIIYTASKSKIIKKRRANFLRIAEALATTPGCRLLFQNLPAGVVPYVAPVIVDNPESVFPLLKQQGVPILRFGEFLWKDIDSSTCSVSVDYSRRIFQFPCHQELLDSELDWMITKIKKSISIP